MYTILPESRWLHCLTFAEPIHWAKPKSVRLVRTLPQIIRNRRGNNIDQLRFNLLIELPRCTQTTCYVTMKELWKSVVNWLSYQYELGVLLFWDTVYLSVRTVNYRHTFWLSLSLSGNFGLASKFWLGKSTIFLAKLCTCTSTEL